MANNWKDIYNSNGVLVDGYYFSKYGKKGQTATGSFTKENAGAYNEVPHNVNKPSILGCGDFVSTSDSKKLPAVYGQDMHLTYLDIRGALETNRYYYIEQPLRDVTVTNAAGGTLSAERATALIQSCVFECVFDIYISLTNCVFKNTAYTGNALTVSNCTYIGQAMRTCGLHPKSRQTLLKNCSAVVSVANGISATQLMYNIVYSTAYAFDGCTFQIGAELKATLLVGNTSDELKQNLIDRVKQQFNKDITLVNLKNWVFSNNSTNGRGEVIKGSEIDRYQTSKGVYFGHSLPVDDITISETITPRSFNAVESPHDQYIEISDNGITLNPNVQGDIHTATSTWIPLGGKKAITEVCVGHNLATALGVLASTSGMLRKVETPIADKNYVIRSNNSSEATVVYNEVKYSSILANNNYIFRTVASKPNWNYKTSNAEIYEVTDLACTPTVDIRLVNSLVEGNITTGNLESDTWYIVEPNNADKPSGSVVCKGRNYPLGASFLTKDTLVFSIDGDCHLRKIAVDNESQNPFVTLAVTNPQAVYKNPFSSEIVLGLDGKPIGSIHPEYELAADGIAGKLSPIKYVFGTLMQLRVGILLNN